MVRLKKKRFPAEFIKEIESRLIAEEERLVAEERRLVEHDPFLVSGRDVGNAEVMDEADEAIGHERVEMEKEAVRKRLADTRRALSKLRAGKYGICEKCGERIDRARLEAHPQANYCVECAGKLFRAADSK